MEATFATDGANSLENSDFFWPGIMPAPSGNYIKAGIKTSMSENCNGKPLHLLVQNLIAELGGVRRCAADLCVSEAQTYKYGQDPNVSGADIPVKHLHKLLLRAGSELTSDMSSVKEMIAFFTAPVKQRVIDESVIDAIIDVLQGGGAKAPLRRVKAMGCEVCGDELVVVSEITGQRVYTCRSCRTNGSRVK